MMVEAVLAWLILTLSLTNMILLLWLGLTVFVGAEQRRTGVWLSSAGLTLGGIFFCSHTAILALGLNSLEGAMNIWWFIGLLAALWLPFLWYVSTLSYSGYWLSTTSAFRLRHRPLLMTNSALAMSLGLLLVYSNPFPSYADVVLLNTTATTAVFGVPLLVVVFGIATLLNIAGSLDALSKPGPARHEAAAIARVYARRWMIATALLLCAVTLLIALVMLVVVLAAQHQSAVPLTVSTISLMDFIISACILLAVLCIGQAITRYEVFSGKLLPRRRFERHWSQVALLAPAFSALMSALVALHTPPIYQVLLTAVLFVAAYIWMNQLSFHERERSYLHLRPFLGSQQLYEGVIQPTAPGEVDIRQPFESLCRHVLNAEYAALFAVGPLSTLVGEALLYPDALEHPVAPIPLELERQLITQATPTTLILPLNPIEVGHNERMVWVIPLWNERGLIGLLLLGNKRDGLYTVEEAEIARATGERLIDSKATIELSRRLIELQRQHVASNNIVDGRVRRILHDDVLPMLHSTMLMLTPDPATVLDARTGLAEIHRHVANLLHELPINIVPEIEHEGLIFSLRRSIDGEWSDYFQAISWQADPAAEAKLARLPLISAEAVFFAVREAVRNAVKHAQHQEQPSAEKAAVQLWIFFHCRPHVEIVIRDNGAGFQAKGPSVERGHGLLLHSAMMAIIGGSMTIESSPNAGTSVKISLPMTDGRVIERASVS